MKAVKWEEIPDEEGRPGVRRRGFGTPEVMLVMNECKPGMQVRPHSHDFDQIAMIVSGTAVYHVGDVHNDVGPGSIMHIPAGGILCHAAVVAREYRLPAVVGAESATSVIPDGALVSVDGASGEVLLLRN
jgi:PEP-utilizing family enzyme/cupin domain